MSCAGAFEGVTHDQQLHDIVVDGRAAGRLNHKYILAAHALIDHDLNFTIVEAVDHSITYLRSQISCNFTSQVRICITGEEDHIFACLIIQHFSTPTKCIKIFAIEKYTTENNL